MALRRFNCIDVGAPIFSGQRRRRADSFSQRPLTLDNLQPWTIIVQGH